MWYRPDGSPCDAAEANELLGDINKRRVAETTLPNGRWVSTVFLALDHSFGGGRPILFETMIFPKRGEWGELDCRRYSTREEAAAGHEEMVAEWRDKP